MTQQQVSALTCVEYSGSSSKSEMGSLCNRMPAATLDGRGQGANVGDHEGETCIRGEESKGSGAQWPHET